MSNQPKSDNEIWENKIELIKYLRNQTGCGLKEARDAVEDGGASIMKARHYLATKLNYDVSNLMPAPINPLNEEKVDRRKAEVDFSDKVNHPVHYNKGSIEVIEMIEDQGHGKGFTIGNAIKYTMRAGAKGDEIEDLEKAIWYLRRRIEQIKAEREKRPALRPNEMPQQRQ